MAKIKRYDKYGTPIYDVSELERYEYSGRKKLYKIPEGGICDAKGEPLSELDLIGLGISLEPEEPQHEKGLSSVEIKQRLEKAVDESELNELRFREACNKSFSGLGTSLIDFLGEPSIRGKHWVELIGEENFKRIYLEQKEYSDQLPSENEISKQLQSIFGVDYKFPVQKYGEVYFVNMIDEDTDLCAKFMIKDKEIFITQDENGRNFVPKEMEEIFIKEKDAILKKIYGE